MNITGTTTYFIFCHDSTFTQVNMDEFAATPSNVKGKYKVAIARFYFDDLTVYFANAKIIAATTRARIGRSANGYRVSANAAGFGNFNGILWKQLGLVHLRTTEREELNRYVYGEIAKIAMERMDRMLLGKRNDD